MPAKAPRAPRGAFTGMTGEGTGAYRRGLISGIVGIVRPAILRRDVHGDVEGQR
jgi:hypothetical protein